MSIINKITTKITNFAIKNAGLFLVLLVMTILLLRGIGNVNIVYSDADRILMDGVFIYDFLKDFPITRLYQYTIEYYAQYPALSIGYRPPFFPFIEAIFNAIFGVEMWSSRLALVAFAIFGLTCWFDLIRRNYDTNTAVSSSLLLVTTPFFATWGWYTMSELPVLCMMMASAYFFFRYFENEKPADLYIFAFIFCMSVWTKQTAAFQVIWMILFMLYKGVLPAYFKRKEVWLSILMILCLIIPLVLITVWLGKQNLAQSTGSVGNGMAATPRISFRNFTRLFTILIKYQVTIPVLLLSLVGAGMAIFKRDGKIIFFALLLVSVYIFFTYVLIKDARYTIFWIPVFTLVAVLPSYYFKKSKIIFFLSWFIIIAIVIFQIKKTYEKPIKYATGYDTVAHYVLKNCKQSPVVLFDGYNNGYFTYFMRALDPKRSMYIMRGDKLFSSSSIFSRRQVEINAFSTDDIKKIVDEYGISCLVVESRDVSTIKIHQIFREYLDSGPFKLIYQVAVDSNKKILKNQTLKVYRYLELKPPTADYLEIKLPIVGQHLKIPYRHLLKK